MHRLFQTLVVCGAGLGIAHCGGKSKSDGDQPDLGRGGTDPSSGGSGAGGGGSSSGPSSGTAGETAGGSEAGGADVAGAGGERPRPYPPREQWACDTQNSLCGSNASFESGLYTGDCVADLSRPVSKEDCEPDMVFTCMTGLLLDDRAFAFSCECLPLPPSVDDPCPCPTLEEGCFDVQPPSDCRTTFESLCGCAITCILK